MDLRVALSSVALFGLALVWLLWSRLKHVIVSRVIRYYLSRDYLLQKREKIEIARRKSGAPHEVHFFHQMDDPYSVLAIQALKQLYEKYDIKPLVHLVSSPKSDFTPELEMLRAYSLVDAQRLAKRYGLQFPTNPEYPSDSACQASLARALVVIQEAGVDMTEKSLDALIQVSEQLWFSPQAAEAEMPEDFESSSLAEQVSKHVEVSNAFRERLGHYSGAMFHYGEEWYWAIDRFYHLEDRLLELGCARVKETPSLFLYPPSWTKITHLPRPEPLKETSTHIDFFFSLRSPYSSIVVDRVFALAHRYGASVRLRFVLPMVMRGLPVPPPKRDYILADATREAFMQGIPFGFFSDPVGAPTERGLSLMPLAIRVGCGEEYLSSFMKGVWSQGIDAGTDEGLRVIAQRAGLSWRDCLEALHDPAWREMAERNRVDLFRLGLWGVPTLRVGDVAAWGQDRLWVIEDELMRIALENDLL